MNCSQDSQFKFQQFLECFTIKQIFIILNQSSRLLFVLPIENEIFKRPKKRTKCRKKLKKLSVNLLILYSAQQIRQKINRI